MGKRSTYSCSQYREEMRLLGLRRRLARGNLSKEARRAIVDEIRRLELVLLMDASNPE
jgi:hypothetical protein